MTAPRESPPGGAPAASPAGRSALPSDPRARAALVLLGAVVVFALVIAVIARLAPSPHGPVSSSYATSPQGLAAYAALLDREGRLVRRAITPVAERAPARGETLVVLDPDVIEDDEARAIGRWVRSGGRLVAGGRRDAGWLSEVLGSAPQWRPDEAGRAATLVPVSETAGVTAVRTADGGGWHDLNGALPAVGPPDAPLVVVARSGRGSVALLADASPIQNRLLDSADGAALGLGLAGDRPVAFLETVHGYGVSRGLSALPTRVKWTLLGLLAAGLLALWTAGRRLGPPEIDDTPPAPARIEYVDALAAALARTEPRKRRREQGRRGDGAALADAAALPRGDTRGRAALADAPTSPRGDAAPASHPGASPSADTPWLPPQAPSPSPPGDAPTSTQEERK